MTRIVQQSFLLWLVLVGTPGFSQVQMDKVFYAPPAPNATSLLEYASVPVNLHTGTAEISVPLYQLKGRKLDVPISISYHASGIKVQDISSSVGLGFTLNAGGVVTRIVRGLPDEGVNGYFSQDFNTTFQNTTGMIEGTVDSEPDIFFFNFNGRVGKMVLDPNKNLIQLPEQNLKITAPNFASADPMWEIVDTNGVKYIFGKTSNSRELSSVTLHTQYVLPKTNTGINTTFPDKTYSAISSWYLSEIKDPFETEIVQFTYQSGTSTSFEYYRQHVTSLIELYAVSCFPNVDLDNNVFEQITKSTISSPKYISSIATSLGNASFSYLNDRQDIPNALRLTQVRISNLYGAEVKKISFGNNQYFVSDNCSTSDCKRLKLEELTDITNDTNFGVWRFFYSRVNLPSRRSVQYDHWGYYNNNSYINAIPTSKTYTKSNNTQITFPGADKSPDLLRSQANILIHMINPAGADTQLSYELNEHDNSGAVPTGGLRISQIREDDGSRVNGVIVKTYRYKKISDPTKSSGVIYRKNYYDYQCIPLGSVCPDGYPFYITVAPRSSVSLIDLFDIGGIHVGYSDVQIEYNNNSKEYLFFTNFGDRPDDNAQFSVPSGYSGSIPTQDFTDPDGPPFVSTGDRSFERGLLKQHLFYNASGKKVRQIKNTYDFYLASSAQAPGGKAMLLYSTGQKYGRQGKYYYTHRGVRLMETSDKVYDQSDDTKGIRKLKSFTYNDQFSNLVKTETEYLNNGAEMKLEYKYIRDYTTPITTYADFEADGIFELSKKYVVGIPIETTVAYKKPGGNFFEIIDGRIRTYRRDLTTHITKPYQEFELKVNTPLTNFTPSSVNVASNYRSFLKDTRYILSHTYDSYDSHGNLLQETPENGVVTSYAWGNNNSLVSSITRNPSSGPQSSSYEYLPLVGLTKSIDPANRSTNYTYDKLQRLKLIKDHDLNIVSRYSYHFKNSIEFGIDFSGPAFALVGQSVNFKSISNSETLGVTTYLWDFGDGQTSEGTSSGVYHQYSNHGTYTVKLSKMNPDYGTLMTTKQITVHPPPTVNAGSSPDHADICIAYFSSCTLSATVSGGCPVQTMQWYQIYPNGYEPLIGSGSQVTFIVETTGTHEFKCVVTDECGQIGVGYTAIIVYKSDPNCPY